MSEPTTSRYGEPIWETCGTVVTMYSGCGLGLDVSLVRHIAREPDEVAPPHIHFLTGRPDADLPLHDISVVERSGPVRLVLKTTLNRAGVPDQRGTHEAEAVDLIEFPHRTVRTLRPGGVLRPPDENRRSVLGQQMRHGDAEGCRDGGEGQDRGVGLPGFEAREGLLGQAARRASSLSE